MRAAIGNHAVRQPPERQRAPHYLHLDRSRDSSNFRISADRSWGWQTNGSIAVKRRISRSYVHSCYYVPRFDRIDSGDN
jgi:hypothetical protein